MQSIMNCFVIGEMEKYIYSNIHSYICTYNIENRGAYIYVILFKGALIIDVAGIEILHLRAVSLTLQ